MTTNTNAGDVSFGTNVDAPPTNTHDSKPAPKPSALYRRLYAMNFNTDDDDDEEEGEYEMEKEKETTNFQPATTDHAISTPRRHNAKRTKPNSHVDDTLSTLATTTTASSTHDVIMEQNDNENNNVVTTKPPSVNHIHADMEHVDAASRGDMVMATTAIAPATMTTTMTLPTNQYSTTAEEKSLQQVLFLPQFEVTEQENPPPPTTTLSVVSTIREMPTKAVVPTATTTTTTTMSLQEQELQTLLSKNGNVCANVDTVAPKVDAKDNANESTAVVVVEATMDHETTTTSTTDTAGNIH